MTPSELRLRPHPSGSLRVVRPVLPKARLNRSREARDRSMRVRREPGTRHDSLTDSEAGRGRTTCGIVFSNLARRLRRGRPRCFAPSGRCVVRVGQSPGRCPGLGCLAPAGRNCAWGRHWERAVARADCVSLFAPSGRRDVMRGTRFPGRCPGLCCLAPAGRGTDAANGRDRC